MEISLPWGSEELALKTPESWDIVFPSANSDASVLEDDESAIIDEAMSNPSGSPQLAKMELKDKNILIVIDDNTRPTPVHRFFHLVLEQLSQAGADFKRVLAMPALGIHTPMSQREMEEKAGAENLRRVSWKNHDAFDHGEMTAFGKTGRGTEVVLNKEIGKADLIISIGLIEPHLWAGFGGGMKNILPGLASAECIGHHHSIIADPPYHFNRVGMEPEKNSFRLDLEETANFIDAPIFCLNVTLDYKRRVIGAFAGDPVTAHREGVNFNKALSGRLLDRAVDGIIVNSHPMDTNFKQSMKCVANSLPALKPGGVIMGFLKADRGVDDIVLPEDSKPLWLVKRILRLLGAPRIMWFLEKIKPGLNVEEKFLVYYSMQLIRQYELYLYAPTINKNEETLLGFFKNFHQPQQVIRQGLKKLGKKARVAVFPEAGATFPIIKE